VSSGKPPASPSTEAGHNHEPGGGRSAAWETLVVLPSLLNNGALQFSQILDLCLAATAQALRADAGALLLLDEDDEELVVRAAQGAYAGVLDGRRFARSSGMAGWVLDSGQELVLDDAAQDPRFDAALDLDTGFVTGAVLCMPLRGKRRSLGVVILARAASSVGFHPDGRVLLRAASHQVAMACENERLAAALARAEASLQTLDEARSHFVTLASHELLTPITLLRANAELLHEGGSCQSPCPQEWRDALDGVHRGIDRLQRITGDLLHMEAIQSGKLALRLEPTDVAALLTAVVREMEPLALARQISLRCDARSDQQVILADPDRLQHALLQLVLNGVRFTPDGGSVVLGAEPATAGVLVWVSDTGIGIPRAERERIFERLVELGDIQHHHSGRADFLSRGLGLGLAIVRGIVEAHGGKVWVESEEGRGSDFYLRLPAGGPGDRGAE